MATEKKEKPMDAHVDSNAPQNTGTFTSATPGIPAVEATGLQGALAIQAWADGTVINNVPVPVIQAVLSQGPGSAIYGSSSGGKGVFGESEVAKGAGVCGGSKSGDGVIGTSVYGIGVSAVSVEGAGVYSTSLKSVGVYGESRDHWGVHGKSESKSFAAIYGESPFVGVVGQGTSDAGISGESTDGTGVRATSKTGPGIYSQSESSKKPGIWGKNDIYMGILGQSNLGQGIVGQSDFGHGVEGNSDSECGVYGTSAQSVGVQGETKSLTQPAAKFLNTNPGGPAGSFTGSVTIDQGSTNQVALTLKSSGDGPGSGMQLSNTSGEGNTYRMYSRNSGELRIAVVYDQPKDLMSLDSTGTLEVLGTVSGKSTSGLGVNGYSTSGTGVVGKSTSGNGIEGYSDSKVGVYGNSTSGDAVEGYSGSRVGVYGETGSKTYAAGAFVNTNAGCPAGRFTGSVTIDQGSTNLSALTLTSSGAGWGSGIDFENTTTSTGRCYGIYSGADGWFHFADVGPNVDRIYIKPDGSVYVPGTLYAGQIKNLTDHPLDPANKSLSHASVSSPERKTIYDGVAHLDSHGEAEVTLPSWFEALNTEFRYQLTALGAPASNLHIAQKIRDNHFKIAGGGAGMEICWQVTGVRHDAWAKANPFEVEEDKSPEQLGRYHHPEVFGEPEEKGIGYHPAPPSLPTEPPEWEHHPEYQQMPTPPRSSQE